MLPSTENSPAPKELILNMVTEAYLEPSQTFIIECSG